jgi:hypothetical protein
MTNVAIPGISFSNFLGEIHVYNRPPAPPATPSTHGSLGVGIWSDILSAILNHLTSCYLSILYLLLLFTTIPLSLPRAHAALGRAPTGRALSRRYVRRTSFAGGYTSLRDALACLPSVVAARTHPPSVCSFPSLVSAYPPHSRSSTKPLRVLALRVTIPHAYLMVADRSPLSLRSLSSPLGQASSRKVGSLRCRSPRPPAHCRNPTLSRAFSVYALPKS